MPNFEFRFDLASVLLASVLTVLGISTADAGGVAGGVLHGRTSQGAARATANSQPASAALVGGRGGTGGDFRSGAHPSATAGWGGKGGVNGGDVRNRQ